MSVPKHAFFYTFITGILTIALLCPAAIYLIQGNLKGFLISLIPLPVCAFFIYIEYQSIAPKGKFAIIQSGYNAHLVKRITLTEEEMEHTFGYDYKRYMPDDSQYAQYSDEDPRKFSIWPYFLFLVFSLIFIFIGVCVLEYSSLSESASLIISSIFLTVGTILLILYLYIHIGTNIGIVRVDYFEYTHIKDLFGGLAFSAVGAGLLTFGLDIEDSILAVVGAFFLVFGLLILYCLIETIRPNGKMTVIKDKYGQYVTVSKSTLTKEEYGGVTDSNRPSNQTMCNATNMNISMSHLLIILSVIGVIAGILVVIVSKNLIGLAFVIIAVFPLYLYFKTKRSKSYNNGFMSTPYETDNKYESGIKKDDSETDYDKEKPADIELEFIKCPYCGTINLASYEKCYSCKKNLK